MDWFGKYYISGVTIERKSLSIYCHPDIPAHEYALKHGNPIDKFENYPG